MFFICNTHLIDNILNNDHDTEFVIHYNYQIYIIELFIIFYVYDVNIIINKYYI